MVCYFCLKDHDEQFNQKRMVNLVSEFQNLFVKSIKDLLKNPYTEKDIISETLA